MLRSIPLTLTCSLFLLAGCTGDCDEHDAQRAGPARGGGGPPRAPLEPDPFALEGLITDPSGLPLAGARVRVQGTPQFVLSDGQGRFRLEVPGTIAFPFVLTAGKAGRFNAGSMVAAASEQPTIRLADVPAQDHTDYAFMPANTCRYCHSDAMHEWSTSAMAHAGLNTWVFDMLSGDGTPGGSNGFVYERDSIHRGHSPHSDCANCHAPLPAARAPGRIGMGDPANPSPDVREGVNCDLCHKVLDMDLRYENYPGVHPALVKMRRPRDGISDPVMFGTLDDAIFESTPMRPAFSPALADGSSLCAACHEDNNDHDDDDDREDPGSVPSEETFSEWRLSRFNTSGPGRKSCVDCHMPLTTRRRINSLGEGPLRNVRSHEFRGTTPEFLENALTLHVAARALPGRIVEVVVEVANDRTGHSVPSGVITRNVLLKVDATAGAAAVPMIDGPRMDAIAGVGDPARGFFAGLPGRVYAKVLEDAGGNAPVFYTEAARTRRDDRIRAGAGDRAVFHFQADAAGPVDVAVRLLYRRAYRALVEVKGWTSDGHGQPLADVQPPHFGHLMAERRLTVEAR